MEILVTGGEGQLGIELQKILSPHHRVIGLGKDMLDITNSEHIAYWLDCLQPQMLINCASYTYVDGCEKYPKRAMEVNAYAVKKLAKACSEKGIILTHISTDFIFDGLKKIPYVETDRPAPLNQYGVGKWIGEEYVRHLCQEHYILRTSWLFGLHGHNFIEKILEQIHRKEVIYVVDDQVGTPTYTGDFGRALHKLVEARTYGTYHVTNRGMCSRYELAKRIMSYVQGEHPLVKPMHSQTLPSPARRPQYSALSSRKMEKQCGLTMPTWQNALHRYMRLRKGK